MRTLIFIFTIITSSLIVGQDIAGLWVKDTTTMTKNKLSERYIFKANGEFVYKVSDYDGLNRIREIKGKYKIGDNGTLVFIPIAMKKINGGKIVMDKKRTTNNGWTIFNGDTVNISLKQVEPVEVNLVRRISRGAKPTLEIGYYNYYKISVSSP